MLLIATTVFVSSVGLGACSSEASEPEEIVSSDLALRGGNPCKEHRRLLRDVLAKNNGYDDYEEDDDGWDDVTQGDLNRGRRTFNNRRLHRLNGNGRACADCHQANSFFQLSPAIVKARLDALTSCRTRDADADDPLFRAIDADDFRQNGQAAGATPDKFKNLQFGLVRVPFPLPANVRLVGTNGALTDETEVDVWRSVPSIYNVADTGPDGQLPQWPGPVNPAIWQRGPDQIGPAGTGRGGFQLDARIDTLQNQAIAAFRTHAEVQDVPRQRKLDNLAAWQQTQVTPPMGALSEFEQQGQAVFNRACAQCHGGPSQTIPIQQGVLDRYHDIRTACPRPADSPTWCVASGGTAPCPPRFQFSACPSTTDVPGLQPRTYEITGANNAKWRRTTSDPGRFLLTGYSGGGPAPNNVPGALDDWQKLDNPSLRGIRHTAPYFHNNTAKTLDDVLDHYEQFFIQVTINSCARPQGCSEVVSTGNPITVADRPFTAAERPALRAFLDRL